MLLKDLFLIQVMIRMYILDVHDQLLKGNACKRQMDILFHAVLFNDLIPVKGQGSFLHAIRGLTLTSIQHAQPLVQNKKKGLGLLLVTLSQTGRREEAGREGRNRKAEMFS